MKLRHLHLPGLISYLRTSAIQEHLVRLQLNRKAAEPALPALDPVLLTFQTTPTYTTGRRETLATSSEQIAYLQANGKAEHHPALRGGATTFHGPGQVTAYLVLDLKAHGLGVESYVRLLEDSAMGTCAHYGLETFTTRNPGLWIGPRPRERKLVSLGVHVRRYITSHGLGVNVNVDLWWFDRIVMCGLKGMRATNLEQEIEAVQALGHLPTPNLYQPGLTGVRRTSSEPRKPVNQLREFTFPLSISEAADVLADNLAKRLANVNNQVEKVAEEDAWPGERLALADDLTNDAT